MNIEKSIHKFGQRFGKYKYTALVMVIGVLLMVLPGKRDAEDKTAETIPEPVAQQNEISLEERLETILCQLEGAGKVKVLLTMLEGTSYQYQTNIQTHSRDEYEEEQLETVLVSDGSGEEKPVIVRTCYPVYQGALILCQGADSAAVRLQITQAVADLTGLGCDKICVIKMKGD